MPKNENARSTAATVKRAAEKAACDGAAISTTNFNGSMCLRQVACVADILPVGAEHAISAKTLAAALGLKDLRAVSRLVERERHRNAHEAVAGDHLVEVAVEIEARGERERSSGGPYRLADCDGAESEVVTLEALEIRTGHGFATTPDYPTALLQRRYRT